MFHSRFIIVTTIYGAVPRVFMSSYARFWMSVEAEHALSSETFLRNVSGLQNLTLSQPATGPTNPHRLSHDYTDPDVFDNPL